LFAVSANALNYPKLTGGHLMRIKLALVIWFTGSCLLAQNFQLHYDFGKDRHFLTSTLEMFKPDEHGATFWFVDIDYASPTHTASMAYWEIARYINLPLFPENHFLSQVTATIQYNDGLNNSMSFGNVWLGGFSLPLNLKIITINTDILYRKAEAQKGNFQLTLVWFKSLLQERLTFTGFMDLWGQQASDGSSQLVLLSEPQLWLNLGQHLAVGGELEISRNFIIGAGKQLQLCPTLGFKWNFD